MLRRLAAVAAAIMYSLRYIAQLRIHFSEAGRYLRKSANFALCYMGFAVAGRWREAHRAGLAAFLCCTYDVVTDWRDFDPKARAVFESLLARLVKSDLAALAMGLYEKELQGQLAEDGLERGGIALEFVTRILDTREHFEELIGVVELGMLLQIVDDVLDIEGDEQRGEQNCLLTPHREHHLQRLEAGLPEKRARELFPRDPILPLVVRAAHRKVESLQDRYQVSHIDHYGNVARQ